MHWNAHRLQPNMLQPDRDNKEEAELQMRGLLLITRHTRLDAYSFGLQCNRQGEPGYLFKKEVEPFNKDKRHVVTSRNDRC